MYCKTNIQGDTEAVTSGTVFWELVACHVPGCILADGGDKVISSLKNFID